MTNRLRYCCDQPNLDWQWMLGGDDKRLAIKIDRVFCAHCKTTYLFTGVVETADDRQGVLLEVAPEVNSVN